MALLFVAPSGQEPTTEMSCYMKLYSFILLLLLSGCKTHRTSIDIFFSQLDNTLSGNEKQEIKKCEDLGCLTLFVQKAPKEFKEAFVKEPPGLRIFLSDSTKNDLLSASQRLLILAYQRKLNNQMINYAEINNEIIQFDKMEENKYRASYKKEIQVQSAIAKNNYNKFQAGDTLDLLLPLDRDGNHKGVYFNNFYYKKEYDDTLFLKCILLKKEIYELKDSDLDHDEFVFSLKILDAQNRQLWMVDKDYTKGKTITRLSLYDYGRVID